MALRSFTDDQGRTWQVWQVIPSATLRGIVPRRHRERRGQDVLLYRGPERRLRDRRGVPAGATPPVPRTPETGWLVFECSGIKRRLAPPPPGWDTAPEAELQRLLARARPAAQPRAARTGHR